MRWCVLVFLVGCGGSDDDEAVTTARRCERLRDHVVELRLADINPETGVDREAHRKAMTQALGDDFIAGCKTKLSEPQLDCALAAADPASAAACTTASR